MDTEQKEIGEKEQLVPYGDKIGRVVAMPDSPSFNLVTVRLDSGKRVMPGELLIASCEDKNNHNQHMILRVSGAREFNEYENPLDSQVRDMFNMDSARGREDLLRKFVLVNTEPIELMSIGDDGSIVSGEPNVLVTSGTEVHVATSAGIGHVLGFSDSDSPGAMDIGHVIGSPGIKVVLDANKCLARHMLVVGSTGTGKSYFIGVLSEELKKLGIRHVNIDVHGEMVDAATELGGINVTPGEDLTVKLSSLSEPEIMEVLPLYHPQHTDIAIKAFSNLKKDKKMFGIDDFKDEVAKVCDEVASQKTTKPLMATRVETLRGISIIGSGFEWGSKLKGEGSFVNIDCREISSHSELKVIVGAVARELMDLRKQNKINQIVFSMDEAHLFLPSGETSASSHVLGELIRFGRHHGVGIIIASQSPNDVDRRVAKITNTRVFFAIEKTEIGSVTGLLADTPADIINILPRLRRGTCLLVGSREIIKHSQIVQVRQRKTHDGGETPRMTT